MRPEYDFSQGFSRKRHKDFHKGTKAVFVLLDPDVAEVFKDSDSVNQALRLLLDLAKAQVSTN